MSANTPIDKFKKEMKDGKCIVDFYADWCGPCKMIAPKFAELSEQYKSRNIKFFKVNIDDNEEIGGALNVRSLPTFITMKDGKVVSTVEGADIQRITSALDQLNGNAADAATAKRDD